MSLSVFCFLFAVFLYCCKYTSSNKLEFQDIIFTILSQQNSFHVEKALNLKTAINKETNFSSLVYLSHTDFVNIGDWTILPILPLILEKHSKKFSWLFFCMDDTKIVVSRLKELLENLDENILFIGRGLQDYEPTIIHHFSTKSDFKYPLFASGFALHYTLIQILVEKLRQQNIYKKIDFSIDASYELALFIKQNANGQLLTHSDFFCIDYKKKCATYVKNNIICEKPPAHIKELYFAVKTCHKFHQNRIPVVQQTWGQWVHSINFYSDKYDENIPTVQLKVPNTEHGHCAKTQEIIFNLNEHMNNNPNLKWAVISDDDTLFRLQELLGCYDNLEPLVIGERYGYNLLSKFGYNYVTGGGGVVISKKAVEMLSHKNCTCPNNSTPDDMFLFGICLQQLNIPIVHIPLFHQARPNDYTKDYLLIGPPISFHKHWMVDPIQVYKDWFQLSDILSGKKYIHTEL